MFLLPKCSSSADFLSMRLIYEPAHTSVGGARFVSSYLHFQMFPLSALTASGDAHRAGEAEEQLQAGSERCSSGEEEIPGH